MADTNTLPSCWSDLYDALEAGIDRVILYGPPGTGKTYAGLTIGNVQNGSFRVICNEDMTDAEVTGSFRPTASGVWQWHTGAVINAWDNGGRVVADEIDKASGDVLATLLAMFDTPESASWTNPENGMIHTPQAGFSVVMTTNVEDMRDLPMALKDRFPVAIRIDQPHPNALLALSPDLREAARNSADADRGRRFSIRTFQAFDKLRGNGMDMERAAKIVFGAMAGSVLDAIRVEAVGS